MADHNLPTIVSTYADVLIQLDARLDDISRSFSTEYTAPTNLTTGSIRWNNSSSLWEKYSGTTWANLASAYAININGSIGATTPNTGSFTTLTVSGTATLPASTTVGGNALLTTGANTFNSTQTFSNSTAPIISAKLGTSISSQHIIPTGTSDTFALLTATQALSNKSLDSTCTWTGSAVKVAAGDGTVTAPSITFSSGNTTGFYWGTANKIFITNNGVKTGEIQPGGALVMVGSISAFSDSRLKKDLVKITSALDKVDQLVGYTYTRIDNEERNTGLLAQDVQKVLPEAINTDGEYLAVSYGNILGLIVEAIKELRQEVKSLK